MRQATPSYPGALQHSYWRHYPECPMRAPLAWRVTAGAHSMWPWLDHGTSQPALLPSSRASVPGHSSTRGGSAEAGLSSGNGLLVVGESGY